MTVSEQADAAATNAKANELVVYETLDEGRIARIWLNRPDAHNAQNRTLLVLQLGDVMVAYAHGVDCAQPVADDAGPGNRRAPRLGESYRQPVGGDGNRARPVRALLTDISE